MTQVEVTQADRNEASALGLYFYTDAKRTAMQTGEMDDHPFVQAFARHRQTAEAAKDAEIARLRKSALRAMQMLQAMGDTEEGVTMAFRELAEAIDARL